MIERRAHARFEMVLPVLVTTDGRQGHNETYRTRLENISASGLYLKLDHEIPIGSAITAVVTLADETNLAVEGEVIRSSAVDGNYGLAVRYSTYRFDDD